MLTKIIKAFQPWDITDTLIATIVALSLTIAAIAILAVF